MVFSRKSFLSTSFFGIASIFFGSNFGLKSPNSNFLIKPKKLPKKANLGLISPASPIYNTSDYERMISSLEDMGYTLSYGDHIQDKYGYLAGIDENRVADLHAMFLNKSIDGILCTRGGYGSNRILKLIDYDIIKNNPKPFIGFSDITSLNLAIYKKTGLVTFHGPVGKSYWNDYTYTSWKSILHDADSPIFYTPKNQQDVFTINSGKIEGKLLGGNLTVLTSLIGSDYMPSFKNSILFIEDVGEKVYRVDRMLSQLALSGILNQIKGFIFGKCTECTKPSNSLTLKEVLYHYIKPLQIPAFYGAMISHEEQNLTIPIGIRAHMDADKQTIKILEPAVI